MAGSNVKSLIEAQCRVATNEVREVSRRIGVNWAIWSGAGSVLADAGLDRIELAEWLSGCEVKEISRIFGVQRYYVEADAPEVPLESSIVIIHPDLVTIEVLTLKAKES
jgi:hypothetical protein